MRNWSIDKWKIWRTAASCSLNENYKNKMHIEQNRKVQLITDNVNVHVITVSYAIICCYCAKRPLVLQYMESGCSDTLNDLPVRNLESPYGGRKHNWTNPSYDIWYFFILMNRSIIHYPLVRLNGCNIGISKEFNKYFICDISYTSSIPSVDMAPIALILWP